MTATNKPGLVAQRGPGGDTNFKNNFTTFAELGISTKRSSGEEKTTCPKCSHTRKNQSDPCLSVNHNEGVYYCHHCSWAGRLSNSNGSMHANIIYDYCDENGTVLYQKIRSFPKKFWQQTPDGKKNLKGVRRVL